MGMLLASLRSRDVASRPRRLVQKKVVFTTATSCQQKTFKNFELITRRRHQFQFHKEVEIIIIIKFLPFDGVVRRRREAASGNLKLAIEDIRSRFGKHH